MGGEGVVAPRPLPSNVVFDVDGCLTLEGRAIPGAAEALAAVDRCGARWIIATNNSTRTAAAVADHLSDVLGYPIPGDRVLTSAEAAAGLLDTRHDPALVIGEEGLRAAVMAAGLGITQDDSAARSVVVGLDRSFDFAALARAGRAVARGALLVASNDDPSFPHPAGDLPGAGALVAAIEVMSGHRAIVAGKPHEAMLERVARRLLPGTTWLVGDRPETDMAMARAGGWVGILVMTGVCRDPGGISPELRPDVILASVADLPGLL